MHVLGSQPWYVYPRAYLPCPKRVLALSSCNKFSAVDLDTHLQQNPRVVDFAVDRTLKGLISVVKIWNITDTLRI